MGLDIKAGEITQEAGNAVIEAVSTAMSRYQANSRQEAAYIALGCLVRVFGQIVAIVGAKKDGPVPHPEYEFHLYANKGSKTFTALLLSKMGTDDGDTTMTEWTPDLMYEAYSETKQIIGGDLNGMLHPQIISAMENWGNMSKEERSLRTIPSHTNIPSKLLN